MSKLHYNKDHTHKLKEFISDLEYVDNVKTIIKLTKSYNETLFQYCLLPSVLVDIVIKYINIDIILSIHGCFINENYGELCISYEVVWKDIFNFVIEIGLDHDIDDSPYYSTFCVQFNDIITVNYNKENEYVEMNDDIIFHAFIRCQYDFFRINYDDRMNINVFFDCYMARTYGINNYIYENGYQNDHVCKYINVNKYRIQCDDKIWTIVINDHKQLKLIIIITKMLLNTLVKQTHVLFDKYDV